MKLVYQSGPQSGQVIEVKPGQTVTFGRESDVDIVLDDPRVSRPHARLRVDAADNAVIEDLGSTNGTFVNGRRIEATPDGSSVGGSLLAPLQPGDTLTLGNTRFSVGEPVKAGQQTIVAVATTVTPTPSGLTSIRQSAAAANRRSTIAIGVAVAVIAVAVIGGGFYFLVGKPMSNDEIVTSLKPSIVRVTAQGSTGTFGGTGWVIDADKGLIVTNNHVIAEGQSFTVGADGITPRTANVLASSPCDDVALLHVDDKAGLTAVKTGTQSALHQGDDVLALGFPGTASADRLLVVTPGAVSVVKATVEDDHANDVQMFPNMILHTAKINHGNSGGPLVNRSGQVVGMNTLGYEAQDQNWSIGIDRINELLPDLSNGHGLGWTGMSFVTPTFQNLADLGFDPAQFGYPDKDAPTALLVVGAVPGSEADIAGFNKIPLLLRAVDGHPVADTVDFCAATRGKRPGESSTLALTALASDGTTKDIDFPLHYR